MRLSLVLFVCLVALTGCLKSDGKFEVKGTVTYDGQSVGDGMIVFMPLKGEPGGSESTDIKNGGFTVRLPEGKRTVQVFGYRPGPEIVSPTGGQPQSTKEQFIPEAYNAKSALSLNAVKGMAPLLYELTKPEPNIPGK